MGEWTEFSFAQDTNGNWTSTTKKTAKANEKLKKKKERNENQMLKTERKNREENG